MENYEIYKKPKKEVKKVVSVAKFKAYDGLYIRSGTREGENDIFKLTKKKRNER